MVRMRKMSVGLVALPLLICSAQALAAPVTLVGTNVSYSFDDAQLGLFGSAALSGNDLVFTPTSFAASSAGQLAATQTIHVTVNALAGYTLTRFSLNESGGNSLSGPGAQTWVTGTLGALDIEGDPNLTEQYQASSLASAFASGSWTAQAAVNLPASGWGGNDGIVGSVGLTISNQLFAYAPGGSAASIHKDLVTLTGLAVAAPVPEASTYGMMLAGLGLVGFVARRARRPV